MTPSDEQAMRALWPDHTLCEVAKEMGRSKSWVHKWSGRIGLPSKPKSFRRATAAKLEKGKRAIGLRKRGWTWEQIAQELGLSHRGHAHTLADFAAERERSNGRLGQ